MPRKKYTNIASYLSQAKNDIDTETEHINVKNNIPDIITFCYDTEYLNLAEKGITLRPFQQIILKIFYRGSVGNEDLILTEKEIKLCKDCGLDDESHGDTLGKYYTNDTFRELVLVWGRRCVGEKTKIIDPKTGKIDTIGNLWDKEIKKITSYSLNKKNYKISAIDNADIIYNGVQPTYKMILSDGRFIEATDNHPFLTIDGWKNLSELKKGDRIAVPRSMPIFGNDNSISVEDAYSFGRVEDDCDRCIPEHIEMSPKNIIESYLKSLFLCDLSCASCNVYFETMSKSFAYGVHHLLVRLGIFSRIKKINNKYRIITLNVKKKDLCQKNDDIIWLPIKSIESNGEQRTFDVSVNDDNSHNFVANDIICHNSGKDFVVSLIAAYEAMKLLESPLGDPYAIYNISSAATINILTIANSAPQAETAFNEIRDRILGSKYFANKIGPDGLETSKIYLATQQDRKENQERVERGLSLKKGSILIEVGHSNSTSLLGKGVFVLILDEVASYKRTGGSSSGEQIYTNLTPSLNTYRRLVPAFDEIGNEIIGEDGKPKIKIVYDSKMISISSPLGEEGIFYDLYKESPKVPTRLACRLPTWVVAEELTEASLRETSTYMTEVQFMMQFGAEFSGMGGESFFPRHSVEDCFRPGYKMQTMGKPGVVYFAHLDPATSNHNYALAILHREMFFNTKTNKNDFNVIVDHIKYWHPTHDKPINTEIIDEYVIGLRKKFYFGLITYDVWNSTASIQKLRKFGIPAKCTHYNKRYKMTIYDELYNLVISGKIRIPPHSLLRDEMIHLQRKFVPPSGYSVFPKKEGETSTDDIVDSIAGACYNAISFAIKRLPNGQLVNTGSSPSSNNMQWNSMSGPMGFGTGQQVSNRLERLNSWPNSKRH